MKTSVFAETSLTESDFDAVSNLSLSAEEVDDNIRMEFFSREGAEEWIEQLKPGDKNRRGSLLLRGSHGKDESDVDAYLVFQPK